MNIKEKTAPVIQDPDNVTLSARIWMEIIFYVFKSSLHSMPRIWIGISSPNIRIRIRLKKIPGPAGHKSPYTSVIRILSLKTLLFLK